MNVTKSLSKPFVTEDAYARLAGEVQIEGTSIRVTYTVSARQSAEMLIFDALLRPGAAGDLKYDRTLAFVSFLEPSTIALKRVPPPVPTLMNVLVAHEAFAHLVVPGTPTRGEVLVSVPVEEYNPYYQADDLARYRNVTADRIRLFWVYVPLVKGVKAAPVEGLEGLYGLTGSGALDRRQLEAEIVLPSPIGVKVRTDLFERI